MYIDRRINKKRQRLSKGYSELTSRRQTGNAMAKKKGKTNKQHLKYEGDAERVADPFPHVTHIRV